MAMSVASSIEAPGYADQARIVKTMYESAIVVNPKKNTSAVRTCRTRPELARVNTPGEVGCAVVIDPPSSMANP